jgi:3-dehydro-L-gulonate 2-dehydrogenase
MRVMYEDMKQRFMKILLEKGFNKDLAEEAAIIFTDNTCDGVASHGLNRFHRIGEYIEKGNLVVNATPEVVNSFGSLEVYDGREGLGPTNASFCMRRSIDLAKHYGIGCVSIRNTNHWMRGATYGLQAAKAGVIGICFTNTMPNMPVWGGKDRRIGNNPLILALPFGEKSIVLDMAMSQFSYGKMESLAMNDESLPLFGGYDSEGSLTTNPKDILKSGRVLPIGFWKGSGLSLMLDLLATVLSAGDSTKDIGEKPREYGLSQVFITIDPEKTTQADWIKAKVEDVLSYVKAAEPIQEGKEIFYPSEQSAKRREENLREGIPVNETIWNNLEKAYK